MSITEKQLRERVRKILGAGVTGGRYIAGKTPGGHVVGGKKQKIKRKTTKRTKNIRKKVMDKARYYREKKNMSASKALKKAWKDVKK